MANIYIVGAGQLGSRHLQALKKVKTPLSITVVDPFPASLETAKERYDAFEAGLAEHKVRYAEKIDDQPEKIDLAIIPTSANARRGVIEKLLEHKTVKYFILEKILFPKAEDYEAVGKLLKAKNSTAWVNCSMRNQPFYREIKKEFAGSPIHFSTSGSQYNLITNSIHYVDYMAYLTDQTEFTISTDGLDPKPFESKRKGFLELNGTLTVKFKDGSFGTLSCDGEGDAPIMIQILSDKFRCISRESENRAWVSTTTDGWQWQEVEAKIPYQSEATTWLADEILEKGSCPLVTYEESAKIHLQLLEPLREFLNKHSAEKYDYYPFT